MKLLSVGFGLMLMTCIPVATWATDFQIEKIVNEALSKTQAIQTTPETSQKPSLTQGSKPSVVTDPPPSDVAAKTVSDAPDRPEKALKTDADTESVSGN